MTEELKKLYIAMENADSFSEMMAARNELLGDRLLFNDRIQAHEIAHFTTISGDTAAYFTSPTDNGLITSSTGGNTLGAIYTNQPFYYGSNNYNTDNREMQNLKDELAQLKAEIVEIKKKLDNRDKSEFKEHRKLEVL